MSDERPKISEESADNVSPSRSSRLPKPLTPERLIALIITTLVVVSGLLVIGSFMFFGITIASSGSGGK